MEAVRLLVKNIDYQMKQLTDRSFGQGRQRPVHHFSSHPDRFRQGKLVTGLDYVELTGYAHPSQGGLLE